MSFKNKLEQFVKERHQVTYDELVDFTNKEGSKIETMVRDCRRSELIHPDKNIKGHITGYYFKDKVSESVAQFLQDFPSKPKVEAPKGLF